MLWAQIAILVFLSIGLLSSAHQHGKPRTGKHHFGTDLSSYAVAFAIYYFAGALSHIFH